MAYSFWAKAPATMMMMGEHSVLWGSPAIVQAFDRYVTCCLSPRCDGVVHVASDLGTYTFHWSSFPFVAQENPLEKSLLPPCSFMGFVRGVLAYFFSTLYGKGMDITITSTIDSTWGLGSSAATVVSMIGVMNEFLELALTPFDMIHIGQQIVGYVQGAGSGADIAGSTMGGMVAFYPRAIEQCHALDGHRLGIVPIYCGYKIPTSYVIEMVKTQANAYPSYRELMNHHGALATLSIEQLKGQDIGSFLQSYQGAQGVMKDMGLSSFVLDAIVSFLSDRGMVGKISGSGLGDCVMGLWDQKQSPDPTLHHHNGPGIMIPAKPDHQGLVWWKGDTSPNSWGD